MKSSPDSLRPFATALLANSKGNVNAAFDEFIRALSSDPQMLIALIGGPLQLNCKAHAYLNKLAGKERPPQAPRAGAPRDLLNEFRCGRKMLGDLTIAEARRFAVAKYRDSVFVGALVDAIPEGVRLDALIRDHVSDETVADAWETAEDSVATM